MATASRIQTTNRTLTISPVTPGTVSIINLLAGDLVSFAQVEVTTLFDAASTMTLGFSTGSGDEVLAVGTTDLERVDSYASATAVRLASAGTLNLTFTANGATAGAARLFIIIEREQAV